MHKVT
jgi:hypothetical protein